MKKINFLGVVFVLLLCVSCSTSNNDIVDKDNDDNDIVDFDLPDANYDSSFDESEDILIDLTNKDVSNNNGFVKFENDGLYILLSGSYVLSGEMEGRVVVACDGDVELVLSNCSISSKSYAPIIGYSLDNLDIKALKNTENYILDNRTNEGSFNSAIYSDCDLTIKGSGILNVTTTLNNGIHSKDDLKIKNLELNVTAVNNAIKGNDSITITDSNVVAISSCGDALKTTNSDISSKGNQRGNVTISGGSVNLYAALDGIDASYDVTILNDAIVNILTDSYSEYSSYVSSNNSNSFYIRYDNSISSLALTVYFSDGSSKNIKGDDVNGGFNQNCMSFSMPSDAVSFKVSGKSRNNSFETDVLNINLKYDCIYIDYRGGNVTTRFETYSISSQPSRPGIGGMNDGNQNKSDYSSKGIKADNEINISSGNITISAHDDGIHVNSDVLLENGNYGLGNINITGGDITITSDDDGIHADYSLNILGGNIKVLNSYEGLEANVITIDGGICEIKSSDDGINATKISQTPYIYFKSGVVYIDADGDGIDSNGNILMTGGYVVAIGPSNGGNGVLDFDGKFEMTGGYLLACGASGMDQKPTLNSNVSGSTAKTNASGKYITLNVSSKIVLELYASKSNINYIVYAGYGSDVSYSICSSSSISDGRYGVEL